MTSGIRFVSFDDDGTLVRHSVDQVNNNLTATLRWCRTHVEPVWVFNDGSYECPHTTVVGWSPDEHDITEFPRPFCADCGGPVP